jgi:apolipoprotein N-acyltransferase
VSSRSLDAAPSGARRFVPFGCAALAAALYTLASPPRDLSLLAWLVPGLLLCPLAVLSMRRAALAGGLFGVGIGAGVTTWAVHASLRYFELDPIAATSFAVLVWVLASGIPYAFLGAAFVWLTRRTPPALHPVVAGWLWVLVEIGRSLPPFGLPWGLLSHTQWRSPWLIQIADLGGAYAVTFLIVLASTAIGAIVRDEVAGLRSRRVAARLFPAAIAICLTLGYGVAAQRSRETASTGAGGAGRRVAVVQGAGADGMSWRRIAAEREVLGYLRLSSTITPAPAAGDLVVWPENAVDLYLDREPLLLARLGGLARRSGADLLVGAPRLDGAATARNAAYLIGSNGRLRGAYDKRVLVPLAESTIFGPEDAVASEPRYAGGSSSAPLSASSFELGTVICFEVLFPQLVRDAVRRGADLLVNVSNDSWLDEGAGTAPKQHFAMSVLRAVETRRYLVRASAGGRSGIVSPLGEVDATVEWGETGVAVGRVEPRTEITPYVRFGESWVLAVGAAIAIGSLVHRRPEGTA